MMMLSLRLKIADMLVHNGVIRSNRICTDHSYAISRWKEKPAPFPQYLRFHNITAPLEGQPKAQFREQYCPRT